MAVKSKLIAAPPSGMYRVAKDPDPFTLWPPRTAADMSAAILDGNRWDDPKAEFATMYGATDPVEAFGETIARYRTCDQLTDRIEAFFDGNTPDPEFDPLLEPGRVPGDYFANRYLGHGLVTSGARFADVEHPDTHAAASLGILPRIRAFTPKGTVIDRGTMHSQDRRITRTVSRHFYELAQTPDHTDLRGLRYESRILADWECWVIWEPSPMLPDSTVTKVTKTNPDLLKAAELLDLAV